MKFETGFSHRPFHYPKSKSALHCEGVSLPSLAKKYGTPLYVYSAGQILDRYRLFSNAFAHREPLICYSVKANSNLSILKLLAAHGSGFDIVSGGELHRILEVNKKAAHRVVFSGVGKTAAEIDLALAAGILIFNVESESEVALLAERAQKRRVRARVALRVNPDVFAETHPYISTGLREHKFGIDIKAARPVYQEVKRSRYLDPVGISVHIGSQIQTAEPFGAALAGVAELIRELEGDGIQIKFVDAGGGLGIDYRGSTSSFDPVEQMKKYAAAVDRALEGIEVRLLLEPGRFLIAQAGTLLAKVLVVKRNGSKTFVITDAGMNDLIRPALYQAHHEILPVLKNPLAKAAVVDIVGPVCETGDFFARDREMPEVKEGDLMAMLDTGAYGMSLSSNYNSRPRPAEVLVEGKRARLIRRRETMRDLVQPESRLV
ncbi:MAG TPA: diaminopimelate decarboxylase [Acidobacteriaceae bacterium]|nr:diaminopimelate decarboxylase [Acidobacteriaceae bacterium]